MKFQKYLFRVTVNDISVAKYLCNDGAVLIQAEKDGEQIADSVKIFKTHETWEEWIDRIVPDSALDNEAACLALVLAQLNVWIYEG